MFVSKILHCLCYSFRIWSTKLLFVPLSVRCSYHLWEGWKRTASLNSLHRKRCLTTWQTFDFELLAGVKFLHVKPRTFVSSMIRLKQGPSFHSSRLDKPGSEPRVKAHRRWASAPWNPLPPRLKNDYILKNFPAARATKSEKRFPPARPLNLKNDYPKKFPLRGPLNLKNDFLQPGH